MIKDILIALVLFASFIAGAIFGGAFVWAGLKETGKIFQHLIDGYMKELYVDNSEKKE